MVGETVEQMSAPVYLTASTLRVYLTLQEPTRCTELLCGGKKQEATVLLETHA